MNATTGQRPFPTGIVRTLSNVKRPVRPVAQAAIQMPGTTTSASNSRRRDRDATQQPQLLQPAPDRTPIFEIIVTKSLREKPFLMTDEALLQDDEKSDRDQQRGRTAKENRDAR